MGDQKERGKTPLINIIIIIIITRYIFTSLSISMKLISLNTGTGMFLDPLLTFLTTQRETTDIFCLQEVTNGTNPNADVHDLQAIINPILSDYTAYIFDYESYGGGSIITYINSKKISVQSVMTSDLHHEIVTTKRGEEHNASLIIDTTIQHDTWNIHIINIHGLRHPWDKLDTDSRDIQTEKLIAYITQHKPQDRFIIIWDFNLAPNTKLITTLSEKFINLNTKFNITDTRGAGSPYYGREDYQWFADYAFSSKNLHCTNFTTYEEVVSDHKALLLDFNLSS